MIEMTARHASLGDLRDLLVAQHGRKVDMVVPSSQVRADDGLIRVSGSDPVITEDGVTPSDGLYRPTAVFDEGVADKLGIPLAYLRRLRERRTDLYDANVNGWLHGRKARVKYPSGTVDRTLVEPEVVREAIPGDGRSFLLRTFRGEDGEHGIARAFLSDRYSVMDNLDVLTAALDGVRQAGVNVEIDGCDLTERRMYVRIKAPEVQALAPGLLAGYRSPFSGQTGDDNPTVFAGFVLSNSEVGDGAFSITPRLIVQVCDNGMTITKDALRAVHLGSRMDDGVIRWTEDTQRKQLALVTAKARDAVATFLDVEYMQRQIAAMMEKADKPIDKPEEIRTVTKRLQFSEADSDEVFRMFIQGGDLTAAGVLHAVTAAARTRDNADTAAEMEAKALQALDLAAAL